MPETNGCSYVVNQHTGALCHKVCDAEQTMCPHHILLTSANADAKKPPRSVQPNPVHKTPRAYSE